MVPRGAVAKAARTRGADLLGLNVDLFLVVQGLCLALLAARLLLLVLLFGLLGLDLLGLLLLFRRERVSVCNSPHFSLPNH